MKKAPKKHDPFMGYEAIQRMATKPPAPGKRYRTTGKPVRQNGRVIGYRK